MNAFLPASRFCWHKDFSPAACAVASALLSGDHFICHRPEPVLPPADDDDEDEDDDRGSSGGNIDPDDDEGDFDDDDDDEDETLWTNPQRRALSDEHR